MKVIIAFSLFIFLNFPIFSQKTKVDIEQVKRKSITVGILQGGGSLIGFDYEGLLNDRIGLQIGAGFIGFGFGLNYHLKPGIKSSFLSLQYWHQGIGSTFGQSLAGPNFVYRSKKWFTFQIGIGKSLSKGPLFPTGQTQPSVQLMYAIGAYF